MQSLPAADRASVLVKTDRIYHAKCLFKVCTLKIRFWVLFHQKKKVLDERAPDFETSVSLCPVTLDVLNFQPQPDVHSKTGIGWSEMASAIYLVSLTWPQRAASVVVDMPRRSLNSSVSSRHWEHFQANLFLLPSPVPNKSAQFTHKTHGIMLLVNCRQLI